MIDLNLISSEQKKFLRYEYIYLSLRTVVWMTLTVSIMIAAAFLGARIMLEENYVSVMQQIGLVTQKNLGIDQEINKINLSLKEVANIQKDFVKWSKLLLTVTNNIPSNVSINSLSLEKNSSILDIRGKAASREDLLKLEANLNGLSFLKNVNIPIQYKIPKINVEFQLTAEVDFKKFNQL